MVRCWYGPSLNTTIVGVWPAKAMVIVEKGGFRR